MDKREKRGFPLRLLPGAALYAALLVFALVFTQFLRSSISTVFFLFVCILPFLSLLYTVIGKASVGAYVSGSAQRVEKNSPVEYEIRFINSSIFAFPFLRASVNEPEETGTGCAQKDVIFSLTPLGCVTLKNEVSFRARGLYEIGVDSIYVSDFLRIFSLRLDAANYAAVTVLPRKMTAEDQGLAFVCDTSSRASETDILFERTELGDIKDYFPGAPIRNIHWKLSSKTDEIKIRDYTCVSDKHAYIFCDLARHIPAPEESSSDIYDELKKMLSSDKNKKIRRLKASMQRAKENCAEGYSEFPAKEKQSLSERLSDKRDERKSNAKYKKNIRSGMSAENAETVRMIDELISSTSRDKAEKKAKRNEKLQRAEFVKNEKTAEKLGKSAEKLKSLESESELEKIIEAAGIRETKKDSAVSEFGGRIKKEYLDSYDGFCCDSVIEMTLALVLGELKRANSCTVVWYDKREDSGIAVQRVASEEDYETLYLRLSTSKEVDLSRSISELCAAVAETSNVTVKVVTSNIDPVSVSETERIPSMFGGAGTGCMTQVFMFSPSDKYEDERARIVYTGKITARLLQSGIPSAVFAESCDINGKPVFVSV